jgi:hypothetical protein
MRRWQRETRGEGMLETLETTGARSCRCSVSRSNARFLANAQPTNVAGLPRLPFFRAQPAKTKKVRGSPLDIILYGI